MIRIYALNQEANISTRDCILKKWEGMFLCQSGQEIADVQNPKYLNKSDLLVMIWKMFWIHVSQILKCLYLFFLKKGPRRVTKKSVLVLSNIYSKAKIKK